MEKYSGALLKYKGLKLNSNEAAIFDELPYIYVDVRYKATIFTPNVGDLLSKYVIIIIFNVFFKSWKHNTNFSLSYKFRFKKKKIIALHIFPDLLILGIFNAIIYQENISRKIFNFDNNSVWCFNKKILNFVKDGMDMLQKLKKYPGWRRFAIFSSKV